MDRTEMGWYSASQSDHSGKCGRIQDMGTCKKRKTSQKQSGRNILEMERAAGKPWVLHRAQGTGSGRLWSAYYTKAFLSDCTM